MYRKTSLRREGLLLGTTLNAMIVDSYNGAVYKILRGDD